MKCVMYKGKPIYYKNLDLLSKKLNISKIMASKLIEDNGRRIIKKKTGEVELINIKNENPMGLLSREFNIKRTSNKNLIEGHLYPNKKAEILKELGPEEENRGLNIHIVLYINFGSPYFLNPFHVLDKEGRDLLHNKIIDDGFKYDEKEGGYFKKVEKKKEILSQYDYYKYLDDAIRKHVDKKVLQEYRDNGSLVRRTKHYIFSGEQKNIERFVQIKINEFIGQRKIRATGMLVYYSFWVGSTYQDKKLKFENGYIRDFVNEFELTEWTNIQYNYKNKNGDTCAVAYIGKRFPELYWDIKELESEHGIQVKEFIEFCKKHDIGYNIYNEKGEELYKNEGKYGMLSCIIYNNHIYPLLGGKPKRYSCKEYNIHLLNSEKKFEYFLNKNILPSNIKIGDIISKEKKEKYKDINIISFTVKNDKYIFNPDYQKCLNILEKMGLEQYMYDNIRITDICKLLEKIYKTTSTASFFPEKYMFKTPPLYYKTKEKINKKRKIVTIDKNKCYAYALYSLPYLIVFDWRKHKVNENPKTIEESFMYIAKPKKWTILMPCTKLYSGYHLIECKNMGIEFELLEELETITVPNYYRKIIRLMFENMDEKDFKDAMVILIGKFERDMQEQFNYKYIGTYNEESADMYNGFTQKIGNHTLFFKESKKIKYARDKIPIATQVKDMSRMLVSKKISELKIRDDDVIQINTDSITYYGNLPSDLNKKLFDGWKEAEFKDTGFVDIYDLYEYNNQYPPTLIHLKNESKGYRKLYMKYAGSGKTTTIIEEIIPKLEKSGKKKDKYIVLTPTHSTLDELKRHGINCEIVHKFTFSETLPKEHTIIFDEIGFADLSCHDLLYKCNMKNKNIICFGDFNQLLPIEEDRPCNQPHYLNFLFQEIDTEYINYRNNFTKEYYDQLINEKIDIVKEVNKYSSDIDKAEVILCYRTDKSKVSKTRDIYNEKILKKLGKKWNDVGVKLICTDNTLIDKNIYNHKQVTIKECFKETPDDKEIFYKLEDDLKNEFIVTERQLKHFRPAYAINVYEAQGMTLKSYHWAQEDNKFLYGNMAYTIISRLKQKK